MFLPYAIDNEVDYEGFPFVLYFLCGACIAVHIALYEYMPGNVREGVFYTLGYKPGSDAPACKLPTKKGGGS